MESLSQNWPSEESYVSWEWAGSILPVISHDLGAFIGGMVVAQRLQWISEASAGGPSTVMVPVVRLCSAFLQPPSLGS